MAEILGVGLTHSPSLISPDEDRNTSLHRTLKNNDNIPAARDPRLHRNLYFELQQVLGGSEALTS